MNKLGINLWNWEPELSDACLGLPEKIASMGFTAIELPMTQPEIGEALYEEVRQSGLAVSLCAAMGPGRDISNFDPQVRQSTMDYLEKCLALGEKLGAHVFAGPLYAGGGKRHRLPEEQKKYEWDLAVNGLKQLSGRAKEHGMVLALEPICRYRTSVVNTVGQCLAMLKDIDEDNVGLHFDTYQACIEERDLLEALKTGLKSGKLMHVHACANNRGCPGDGIMPWEQIFALLKEYGYEGHITMETFAEGGLDSSWINVHGQPDDVALRGIRNLKKYVS